MTNEEAIEILRTSSWMCLSNNSIKFQEAIEHAYNNLKRIEKISKENTKLKAEIDELKSKIVSLNYEVTDLKEEVGANQLWSNAVERTLKKEIDKNAKLCEENVDLKKGFRM